ncbi:DUF4270 domain-containing protein [Jejudonia soesokkakensis]|uniref:DUF4270 domain-containing protein n=1 Tax=Jejudonia soesokkakensis TaxID=1323432 RepID=A0ABW2MNB0_9FLAO
MKIKYIIPKVTLLLVAIILLASCEEDFATLGADIVGDPNIENEFTDANTVVSYSRKLTSVESNNLPTYQLGTYTDAVYGKSTINLLSQITLDRIAPDFGENTVVDSVIMYIPFFSQATQTTGGVTYTLDSIFGQDPIDISLVRSNFLLRDFDPTSGFEEPQKYYSDQAPLFESFLGETIFTIEDFVPRAEGFIENEGEDDEELIPPGIRVELPKEFWEELIIDQEGQSVLLSNNNFKNYFRGIYFNVDGSGANTNLILFNLDDASITIHYTEDNATVTDQRDEKTFEMSFDGVNVNVFKNDLTPSVEQELSSQDFTNGEETLYARGGSGIATIVELFGPDEDNNGIADELEILREREWLINEANLIFYVDQNRIQGGETEPERIIIYDTKNGQLLVDYDFDPSVSLVAVDSKIVHLERLERGSDEIGDFYKIRITRHISNLINRDSTNVPLAVMVTQNVLNRNFQDLRNVQSPFLSSVPTGGVISPEGTVFHGNLSPDVDKRLKLQIFYTEPN